MTPKKDPDELRMAAESRTPRATRSAGAYFKTASRSKTPRDHTISIRADETLVLRIAEFGNTNNLSLSDAVRALIEVGLDQPQENP